MYILTDENNIIKCMASEEVNLHKDKLHLNKFEINNTGFTVGDEYNPKTNRIKSKPENYPKENIEQTKERKIQDEIRKIAIERLKESGDKDFL